MNKKYKNTAIALLLGCILSMAVGYAVLSQRLDIIGTSNISSNFNVKITNITSSATGGATDKTPPTFDDTSATFSTSLVNPGDTMVYNVTIENQGNLDAILKTITTSDTNNPVITFTYSGVAENDLLKTGETATLTVVVKYDENVTSQPESIISSLTITLDYEQNINSSSGEPEISAADKLIATSVTTGDGLYADTYEEGRYIYAGADPNNYITFNGEEAGWRILSVENDGTLKIIKASIALDDIAFDKLLARTTGYCSKDNAAREGCNAWAATTNLIGSPATFTSGSYSGAVSADSQINTYLNGTYKDTLTEEAQAQITTGTFDVGPVIFNNRDLSAQITNERSYQWNGYIAFPTVSEYLRANTNTTQCGNYNLNQSNYSICKETNWIFDITQTSNDKDLWLVSPYAGTTRLVLKVVASGGYILGNTASNSEPGVVPVLYLKSDITLTGSGQPGDPYVIS